MHPSFPNPSIIEAVCEVRFRLSDSHPWNPSRVGEYFLLVKDEFPQMEPVQVQGIEIQHGPSGLGQRIHAPEMMARFKSGDARTLINLGRGVVGANVLRPYPGWERLREHIEYVWAKTDDLLHPSGVSRVGLRYINVVPLSSPDEPVSAWLVANKYWPASVVESARGILFVSDFQFDAKNRMILRLADQPPDAEHPHGSIVLDMDRIQEGDPISLTRTDLLRVCEDLHSQVWETFRSSLTRQYVDYLEHPNVGN